MGNFVIPFVWENVTPKNKGIHINLLYTGNSCFNVRSPGDSLEGLVVSGIVTLSEG